MQKVFIFIKVISMHNGKYQCHKGKLHITTYQPQIILLPKKSHYKTDYL